VSHLSWEGASGGGDGGGGGGGGSDIEAVHVTSILCAALDCLVRESLRRATRLLFSAAVAKVGPAHAVGALIRVGSGTDKVCVCVCTARCVVYMHGVCGVRACDLRATAATEQCALRAACAVCRRLWCGSTPSSCSSRCCRRACVPSWTCGPCTSTSRCVCATRTRRSSLRLRRYVVAPAPTHSNQVSVRRSPSLTCAISLHSHRLPSLLWSSR
jgi:hypothetical protein